MHMVFLAFSAVIVVGAILWGFMIAGSPMYGRQQRFDEQRLQDLRNIQSEVFNIAWQNGERWATPKPKVLPHALPKDLQEIADNATYQKISTTDPETMAPYEYRTLTANTFELCADFTLVRDLDYDIFWNHPAGHHCYQFDALTGETK
jgi:hypothetical protein